MKRKNKQSDAVKTKTKKVGTAVIKRLPEWMPRHPDRVYKNKGWISWSDFLGTNNRLDRSQNAPRPKALLPHKGEKWVFTKPYACHNTIFAPGTIAKIGKKVDWDTLDVLIKTELFGLSLTDFVRAAKRWGSCEPAPDQSHIE